MYLCISKQPTIMDQSRFTICRAAAGSGKTYTLVRTYLELAFSAQERDLKKRFTRILAITFTNKAANEMKERILRELDNMASLGTQSDMGRDLAQRMSLDDTRLRRYADIVRRAILHNYSDFAVCTIDSFMHRLVRTFAHELGLPMQFDVYTDNSDLIQSAVDDLMALAGENGQQDLTQVMCEFAESKMNDGKSYMIERDLAELAKELFKENTPEYLDKLKTLNAANFCQIRKQMLNDNLKYEQQMASLARQALDIINKEGLDVEDFFHGKLGAGAYFQKLWEGDIREPNSYAKQYLEGGKLGSAKCPKDVESRLANIKPKLKNIHESINDLRDSEGKKYNSRKLLVKNIYSLALINKLNELVGQFSDENEIVHISEFNKRISEVVQNEPTPFIYERIGNRYWNYLIDEFQDTSRMQWQNLVPLIENGVGGGHESLVVGDGKQAIYRFRQGDVDQFVNLPHVDNEVHGRLLESPGIGVNERLDRNFRSAEEVVNFNNGFFEWAIRNRFGSNKELQQIYIGQDGTVDLVQKPNGKKKGGYVQVGFWDDETDKLWGEMFQDIEILVREKGYAYSDMTILARSNKTLSEISTYLTTKGVPVVSSESFLLTQSRVVMLLRSLLEYLLDGNNRVAAARVLHYLEQLGKLKHDYDKSFIDSHQGVNLEEVLKEAGIAINCNRLRQLGLYDCCEEALRAMNLNGIETSYTSTFLNVVAKYESRHRQDLSEFLEWFDKQKDRLSTSTASDLNAVSLMTIHKAKGLESPIVLYPIPFTTNHNDSIWVHIDEKGIPLPASLVHPSKDSNTIFDNKYKEENSKSEMDRMNVLYVALTRPKEKLLVYCQLRTKSSETNYESLLHDYMDTLVQKKEVRAGIFAIGDNSPKKVAEESSSESEKIELPQVLFPDWSNRITIAEQSAKIFGELDETHIRRGNQIHELLALMKDSSHKDAALESFTKQHKLEPNEIQTLASTLSQMISQPEVARFFDPRYPCKNETSLVRNGEVLRPDRIVLAGNETWVVDFKTGMPKVEHHDQVQRYCNALGSMGLPSPRGFLLYIGESHSQVVDV